MMNAKLMIPKSGSQSSHAATRYFGRQQQFPQESRARESFDNPAFSIANHDFGSVRVNHIAPGAIQTKLTVNEPGDKYEREADEVADAVMRMPEPPKSCDVNLPTSLPNIQRKCAKCEEEELQRQPEEEEEEELLQAKEHTGQTPAITPPVRAGLDRLRGSGAPLPPAIRSFFEPRFGADFSGVRMHVGDRAGETAGALRARAFTLGRDIVFGNGQFQPNSRNGKLLLAHELTHVVQQSAAVARSSDVSPERGETAAGPVASGLSARVNPLTLPATGVGIQRQRVEDGNVEAAMRAESICDIPALCRLRAAAPAVVDTERIRTVARRCRPEVFILGDPCLTPAFFLTPELYFPGPATTGPQATSPSASSSSGSGLSGLTDFRFSLGSAQFAVSLPSSITATLPVALRGARSIVFSLQAQASGNFTFTATLNGLRHIRIAATAGVDVSAQRGTMGLTVSTTRTTCQAHEPERLRDEINTAGASLQRALENLQNPPIPSPDEFPTYETSQLIDVVSAIADLYDAVDRSQQSCRQVPVFSVGIQGQTPLGRESEAPASVGITGTLHF